MEKRRLTAKNFVSQWLDSKYRGAKEIGDWTPKDVIEFAEDYHKAKLKESPPLQPSNR